MQFTPAVAADCNQRNGGIIGPEVKSPGSQKQGIDQAGTGMHQFGGRTPGVKPAGQFGVGGLEGVAEQWQW